MKHLPVLLFSLLLFSCNTVNTVDRASATNGNADHVSAEPASTHIETTLSETATPPSIQAELTHTLKPTWEGFVTHKFENEWTRVHKMRSSCIDFDSKNQIWSMFLNLEYFDGSAWNTVPTPNGLDKDRVCPHISKDGAIWFFNPYTQRSATIIFKFDGENWTSFGYPEYLTEEMRSKASMTMDTSGQIWLGLLNCANHSCLYRFDGSQWMEVPFPFSSIYSLSADKKGNLWIGGNSESGVAHYNGRKWIFYDTKTLWPNGDYGHYAKIEPIEVERDFDGSAWVILKFNDWIRLSSKGKIERYPSKLPLDTTYNLNILPDDRGRIWFIRNTTELGYCDYGKNQWGLYVDLPSNDLLAAPTIVPSPSGDLWLVLPNNSNGEAGLYRYLPAK